LIISPTKNKKRFKRSGGAGCFAKDKIRYINKNLIIGHSHTLRGNCT
jgi:hypothetical protein